MDFDKAFAACPVISILRGIDRHEVDDVSDALVNAGIRIIEVPLNGPGALASVERLAHRYGESVLVGAGTVLTPEAVIDVRDAGGRLIVTPHVAHDVIEEAKAEDLICIPGCATPTEGFTALAAGADALKLFPGEAIPPAIVKAWRAVFPKDARLLVVGGVGLDNIAAYRAAGADGFGIGGALYAPGRPAADIATRAHHLVAALHAPT